MPPAQHGLLDLLDARAHPGSTCLTSLLPEQVGVGAGPVPEIGHPPLSSCRVAQHPELGRMMLWSATVAGLGHDPVTVSRSMPFETGQVTLHRCPVLMPRPLGYTRMAPGLELARALMGAGHRPAGRSVKPLAADQTRLTHTPHNNVAPCGESREIHTAR